MKATLKYLSARRAVVVTGMVFAIGGICRGAEGEWDVTVQELASPDYQDRIAAVEKLARCGEEGLDAVFQALFSKKSEGDPEIKHLREKVFRRMFDRVVLGEGCPETGVEWGRLLLIDKTGQAGAVPLVVKVRKGSPADRAGLKPGDSIRAVNDVRLPDGDSFLAFRSMLEKAKPGERFKLQTWRLEMAKEKHRVRIGKAGKRVIATLVMGQGKREFLSQEAPGQFEGWLEANLRRLKLPPGRAGVRHPPGK